MNDGRLPALRTIDVLPFRNEENEVFVALRDNSRICDSPLALSLAGYFVAAHLDGRRTADDIAELFEAEFGEPLPAEQFQHLLTSLDQALLLDNERFAAAYTLRAEAYRASDARDNREVWGNPARMRDELEQLLATGEPADAAGLAGLIAPHLDYTRGAPCYADAYATLARAPRADRYVILGTNHFGRARSVVTTRKDFLTPLGRVPTDRAFLESLDRRLGFDLAAREFDHLAEHSVELQVHLLQVALEDHAFQVVPVLCPDPTGPTGLRPLDGVGPDLGEFADALAELIAADPRSTVLIAGADLSHVGQRFGEPEPTDRTFLKVIAEEDRRLLSLLEQRREEQFVADVRETQNATRICSVGCIYALLRALPQRACRILRYHQAVDFESETHVTCCAALIE